MTTSPRFGYGSQDELPQEMLALADGISSLPAVYRQRLEPLMLRIMESTRRRRRILRLVQEALSQLRLDMKYLLFDLEATRRERDAYRRSLESERGEE
ncbi:MAG: transcriptional regulator [Pirellulaceae bacterium]|nr:MAG: transcriptional regulator [Pirellulaceae bacterium]GIW96325.1 MAG: transcriptional regulator [Pirellulaceae bacterium]